MNPIDDRPGTNGKHDLTMPPEFLGRVMDSVASSPPPSAARSFIDGARDRSVHDAVAALLVAAHLAIRGRVPAVVRVQALALVTVVALLTGAGATLAGTTAVHIAAPILGLDGSAWRDASTIPTAMPARPPSGMTVVAPPEPMETLRVDDGPATDSERRPSRRQVRSTDVSDDETGDLSEEGDESADDADEGDAIDVEEPGGDDHDEVEEAEDDGEADSDDGDHEADDDEADDGEADDDDEADDDEADDDEADDDEADDDGD